MWLAQTRISPPTGQQPARSFGTSNPANPRNCGMRCRGNSLEIGIMESRLLVRCFGEGACGGARRRERPEGVASLTVVCVFLDFEADHPLQSGSEPMKDPAETPRRLDRKLDIHRLSTPL